MHADEGCHSSHECNPENQHHHEVGSSTAKVPLFQRAAIPNLKVIHCQTNLTSTHRITRQDATYQEVHVEQEVYRKHPKE